MDSPDPAAAKSGPSGALIPRDKAADRFIAETGEDVHPHWSETERGQRGVLRLGRHEIPIVKDRGRWKVQESDLVAAIAAHAAVKVEVGARRAEMDESKAFPVGSFSQQVACGRDPRDVGVPHAGSSPTSWSCDGCGGAAARVLDRPECHRCRDWSDCGDDCMLSSVYCLACRTQLVVWAGPEAAV